MYRDSFALCLLNELSVKDVKDFVDYHDKTNKIGHVA